MPRIIPENAERSCIEHEALPSDDGEAEPPCGQHAREMPMREQGHIAIECLEAADQPVGPRRDILW